MRKKVIYIIASIILILIILIAINLVSNNKLINNLYQVASRQNENIDLSDMVEWMVYDNMDSNNIKLLLTFNNDVGINNIKEPNGTIINCNGKTTVGIDYITSLEREEEFIVDLSDGSTGISKIKTTQNEILEKIQNRMTLNDFIVINDITYKIIEINENEITAACHTPFGSYTLSGMDGYNNCVSYLDTACADLYTTESRVLSARSANLDDYNKGMIPNKCSTTYWLANENYVSWVSGRGGSTTTNFCVRCVGENGLEEGRILRHLWWLTDASYSHTLALCPVIKITPNIRNDIIKVDNHIYYSV